MRKRVLAVRSKPLPSRTMFIQIGTNPLFAVIPDTFMDDYIRFLGGTNITRGLKSGTVTREWVLARNPEVVFLVTMGMLASSEKERWASLKTLQAARSHRIYLVDANKACNPSPVSFTETLETMYRFLQKSN